jgi:hypothetical protein
MRVAEVELIVEVHPIQLNALRECIGSLQRKSSGDAALQHGKE